MADTIARKTVPLTSQEAAFLERARQAGTPQYEALVRLAGEAVTRSEAATLHALIAYAVNAIGEEVAMRDYEQLAAAQDEDDRGYAVAMRQRVRDR